MKIMCIYPGATLPGFASLKVGGSSDAVYINHGLSMISAVLKREGHHVYCNDLRGFQNWNDFEVQVKSQDFDMALISFMSCDELFAMRCLEIVKTSHPDKPTIAGGIHLSVTRPKQFLYADCVVLGEGEECIIDIVKYYQEHGSVLPFYEAKPIQNLDSLPFIDRGLFNNSFEQKAPLLPLLPTPFITTIFSRGCDYRCQFCYPSRQLIAGGKKRMRSVDNCVEEFCHIKKSVGIGSLMVHDDLFPEKPEWITSLCQKMLSTFGRIPFWNQMRSSFICKHPDLISKLAEAGLTWVSLGLESGSDKILKFLQKGTTVEQNIEAADILHRNQVNIFGNYILGLPTETPEDVEATGRMLQKIRIEWHSGSIYTAYPGSKLYDYCWKNSLFTGEHYRMTRYPYERKVKGIDYDYIFAQISKFGTYKSDLKQWSKPTSVPANPISVATEKPLSFKPDTNTAPPKKTKTISHFPTHINLPVNTKLPKVSIIMTSYNRPHLLKEAIQSVYDQTLKAWEVIMVDCSSDSKVIALLTKCAKANNFTVLTDLKGMGNVGNISREWNIALDHTQGDYICFLDDDNRKHPGYCEQMSQYLDKHPQYDAVCCFSDVIDLKGNQLKQLRFPLGFNKENILKSNYIDSGEIMIRRSVFDKVGYFDERLTTNDDWDMIIRILYETKGIGIIKKPLTDYRQHPDRRMGRTNEFNPKTLALVRSKKRPSRLNLSFVAPPDDRLTRSQVQVCRGIKDSLHLVGGVKSVYPSDIDKLEVESLEGCDLLVVAAPFQIHQGEMKALTETGIPMLTIHMEDPQGILGNKERDRLATWIVTNDVATIPYYQNIAKDPNKVLFCPSLSISEPNILSRMTNTAKYDVIFCGHAYPSRVQFTREFTQRRPKYSILLIGDGWHDEIGKLPQNDRIHILGNEKLYIMPTLDELMTMALYRIAKIIVCLHRTANDVGGFPLMAPKSVHRGYIEAYSGSLVMIDDKRTQHSFGKDEVVFFSDPQDLRKKIDYYLAHPKEAQAMARKAQRRATRDFTFRARMTKIINCIRSERYNTIIP